ncbi:MULTISPECIES: hypothetical protein [Stenotrophomonas]|uniref:hypothetical protein n=1 Tax=Stenotrophomonas TaxID=40323 RepID=UPI0007703E8E|nr:MULTISPECIES: hypothetical protein [Stenotrophomonas]AMJ56692.1 hypothetical protein AXG53_08610 [Stenotrophomonas sp. KCTC 12332]
MTDSAGQVLDALHADLDALKNAIDAEDHARAEQIVAAHDQRLRGYIQDNGAAGAADALQALLEQQHALTERMRELRDDAAAHLRAERQSTRAANAYQQAGTLA